MDEPLTSECVYVLGSPLSPLVKIGRSGNLGRRLADLQRMSPVPLTVLCTYVGGAVLETALHRHFKDLRTHGEWFAIEGDPVAVTQAAVEQIERELDCAPQSTHAPKDPNANFLIPREVPSLGEEALFRPDPQGRQVGAWPQQGPISRPYHLPPGALLCRCGHEIGAHSNVRPHQCAVDEGWDAEWCLCFGYEGPLPPELAGYDLPGHNWRRWREGSEQSGSAGMSVNRSQQLPGDTAAPGVPNAPSEE
ncbi:GIY-YIG nuclease family protein [Streptomyces samsunensis]|uniref:GIY-YIG nuclease family protein n=1 Tax=Streptomyces malaysiensis TaxID=92644 RepID=UPI001582A1B5|nr:GIY-YIG nuclease family protein [Streptomyces samsunensis]